MKPGVIALASLLCLFEPAAPAQAIRDGAPADRIGAPYDWSHRHVVFSTPASGETLVRVEQDPRYRQQGNRKLYATGTPASSAPALLRPRPVRPASTKIDWSESLGNLNFTNLVNYPAKYSFDIGNPAPNCASDYVIYTLPTANPGAFNLIAFNNLYVNNAGTGQCVGTTPSALFSYNASQNNGPLNSSPVLSEDGTQIAFVEDAGQARLNVLKWRAGNVNTSFGSPSNPTPLANCSTNGDVAPCEYSVQYSRTTATLSAPYVDYARDIAYVSDDNGVVAAISPVFKGGQPAVLYTLSVPGSHRMTPPVYDSVSQNVFVADGTGTLYYIRTSPGSGGVCAAGSPPCLGSPSLNAGGGTPIWEAPLVDSSSGTVFVFSNNGPEGGNSAVVQTTTNLAASNVATIGPSGSQNALAGTFNNNYVNNPATGLLYACGTDARNVPQLYAITFSGTTMTAGPATHGPLSLATNATSCSPLTEAFNQTTNQDELYLSVANDCSPGIAGGCLQYFNITGGFPSAAAVTAAESGGTSGIIIDNVVNLPNRFNESPANANIYFITLGSQSCTEYTGGVGNGNCAVKLTQSGLQ